MPGYILHAKCVCGFERELWPGATISELRVMAYTADGLDLVTVESQEAASDKLTVIEDPCIKASEENPLNRSWGPWGPYRCPACRKKSLQIWQCGYWD
jgi:hypothetical protein